MAGTALSLRDQFPTLQREGVVYLDSAATSQTPQPVVDAIVDYYANHRASVHRGVYPLAAEATELFEDARGRIANWLGWPARDTVFTRNATEALNLVARGLRLGPDDTVALTRMEHHSNLVPWQMTGAKLEYVDLDADDLDDVLARATVFAFPHVSNVLGTITPAEDLVRRARTAGAITVIDGSQAVPQIPVNLASIDADFYAWTGHKAYGPTGVGVLHGRHEALVELDPLLGGGHMIAKVDDYESRWAEVPTKFEAGTSAIAEVIGLGAAVDFLGAIGMDAVRAHELDVTAYALDRLSEIEGITLHGPADPAARGAVVSFVLDYAHPHDIADILGRQGVCVRAGHHCAQVLMRQLGVTATTRASFAVHSTREDVDRLVDGLAEVHRIFGS